MCHPRVLHVAVRASCRLGLELSNVQRAALLTLVVAPVPYCSGCHEDIIPGLREGDDYDELCEQRRLLFVAMTRAKHYLCMSYCQIGGLYNPG